MLELEDFVQVYKLKNSLKKARTVLFDMDGTLLNSEPDHLKAVRRTLNHQNIIYPDSKLKKTTVGKTDHEVFQILSDEIPALKQTPLVDLCKQKLKFFLEQLNTESNVEMNPIIPNLLKQIKSQKIKIGLVTASSRKETMALLKSKDILKYFDTVITSDECYQSKPSPAPYFQAMRKLRSNQAECLILEDSTTGLMSATATNAEVVKVSWYN